MKNKPERILFEGRHSLLDPLIEGAARNNKVVFFQNKIFISPNLGNARNINISYGTFFIGELFKRFNIETITPTYIKNYKQHVLKFRPSTIIALDFIRLSFWQALRYKKRNSQVKIFLFSEVKKSPVNPLSCVLFSFLLLHLKRNHKQVYKILVWSQQAAQFYNKQMPYTEVVVVPAPVDTTVFKVEENIIQKSQLQLLLNARYAAYKNHGDVFKALKRLKEKGVLVRLSCIGRADAGKEKVVKLAKGLGVSDMVTFLDPVPQKELVGIYHQHDVLVLPSYNEAVGMVVPEAMACGLPTITSDTVGANVYVEEGETGLIFKTGDVQELTEAIQKMTDKKLVAEMGQKAAKRIHDKFTVEKCTERFKQALDIP